MYLDYFGLKKKPFDSAPNPEFVWLSEKHAKVMEILRAGVMAGDGCVLLTGDVGTGKTVLAKQTVNLPDVAAIFITVSGLELTTSDLYDLLASEFRINRRFGSREEFLSTFQFFLLRAFASYRKVVIVFDEAQRLSSEILNETVALSHLPMAGRKLLKIFFVGQLEFAEMLIREENRDVLKNITARYCLEALTKQETRRYIEHRLNAAGRVEPIFSVDGVYAIHTLSKGHPGLINIICDHALLWSYSANLQTIERGVVKECSRDLSVTLGVDDWEQLDAAPTSIGISETLPREGAARPPARSWQPLLYLAAAVVLAGFALGLFYF